MVNPSLWIGRLSQNKNLRQETAHNFSSRCILHLTWARIKFLHVIIINTSFKKKLQKLYCIAATVSEKNLAIGATLLWKRYRHERMYRSHCLFLASAVATFSTRVKIPKRLLRLMEAPWWVLLTLNLPNSCDITMLSGWKDLYFWKILEKWLLKESKPVIDGNSSCKQP